ncbi:MAG TPA: hypothetical protein VNZ58_00675 [Thermomicrobiales bacterium]|nr:hypothetical protein [Thermomicrobiales bacterium]
MNIEAARSCARNWVEAEGVALPGFVAAFLAGSTNDLSDDAELEPTSDLDVMVVLEGINTRLKPGKFVYRGVLLEVSIIDVDVLSCSETVLGHYHLGRVIATARILADPTGLLTRLRNDVADHFGERKWIEKRTHQAAETVLVRLDSITPDRPFEERVMAWLFAVCGLPHVLLVAGLRNPTVRKRYVAVKALLAEASIPDGIYDAMLDALDPERLPASRVLHHLNALAGAFDAASGVVRSPVFFASDLSQEARPLAIDGSRELIDTGLHRETLFWIVATFCRCQIVLHADAPSYLAHRWDDAFRSLLADLGITSGADLVARGGDVRALLPTIREVARQITGQVEAGPYPS